MAYAESHDQALVGDKTLAQWLYGDAIYHHMHVLDGDGGAARATALHKLIRLITLSAGGEAYLNFMGNEFGHPEWIDFPREGNNWSYTYARRQWSLADDPKLKYKWLLAFDRALTALISQLQGIEYHYVVIDEERRLLSYARDDCLFVFNF